MLPVVQGRVQGRSVSRRSRKTIDLSVAEENVICKTIWSISFDKDLRAHLVKLTESNQSLHVVRIAYKQYPRESPSEEDTRSDSHSLGSLQQNVFLGPTDGYEKYRVISVSPGGFIYHLIFSPNT